MNQYALHYYLLKSLKTISFCIKKYQMDLEQLSIQDDRLWCMDMVKHDWK